MKHLALSLTGILTIGLALCLPAQGQSAQDLLQQGSRLEQVEGNYEGAIALYRQVAEDKLAERRLVASALLQMGKAYEILGRDGAREAYTRIVREYADYPALAAEARAGYERLTPVETETVTPGADATLVTPDGAYAWGASFSSDGSLLAVPGRRDSVFVQDVETGRASLVSLDMGEGDEGGAEFVALSPDNTTLAAGWYPSGDTKFGTLRTVDLESGEVTELLNAKEYWAGRHGLPLENANVQAHQWTADGKSILAYLSSTAKRGEADYPWFDELVLVHVDGSAPTMVLDIGENEQYGWAKNCITSDGRYVFSQFGRSAWNDHYITRIDVQSGERRDWKESSLYRTTLVGCASNPERVLFVENLPGGKRLMSAPPESPEEATLHAQLPLTAEFGLASRHGDVVHWPTDEVRSFWSAELDPERLSLAAEPTKVSPLEANYTVWSANPSTIAYTDRPDLRTFLWNTSTGERRELPVPEGSWVDEVSPDGSLLKLAVSDTLLYFDLETSTVVRTVPGSVFTERGLRWSWGVEPEGTEVAWSNADDCLVSLDMTSYEVVPIHCIESESTGRFITRSPSGSQILLGYGHLWGTDRKFEVQIEVVDLAAGTSKTVYERKTPGPSGGIMGWASWIDDKTLLLRESAESINHTLGLHMLDIASGIVRPVLGDLVDVLQMRSVLVSPDRRHAVAIGSARTLGADASRAQILRQVTRVAAESGR